jgi:hypothetical protein
MGIITLKTPFFLESLLKNEKIREERPVKKNFQKKREKPTEGREKSPKKSDSGIRENKITIKSHYFSPNT